LKTPPKIASYLERLYSLLLANRVFKKVSGIILGKHERFDDQGTGKRPCDILQEVAGRKDIPFLAEFDCCHTHPLPTLPIGIRIHFDATNQKTRIMENWLR
jgi:muramoyltetrapeptide carboxypeptidase LdcA involved in peptidoglycan recycling